MKIGIIDIETTGFFEDNGKIVEFGISYYDTVKDEATKGEHFICREQGLNAKDRQAWVFLNTSLTVEEVRNSKYFNEMHELVQSSINACCYVTAFNKQFDFTFLRSRGIEIFNEAPCIMEVATNILNLPNKYGYDNYKWPNVNEAWEHYFPSIEYNEIHRALDDSYHEALIAGKQIQLKEMIITGENDD